MNDIDLPELLPGHTRLNDTNISFVTVKNDELYWRNRLIKAETKLTKAQTCWARLIGGLALLASATALINSLISINKEFCKLETRSCREQPVLVQGNQAVQGIQNESETSDSAD